MLLLKLLRSNENGINWEHGLMVGLVLRRPVVRKAKHRWLCNMMRMMILIMEISDIAQILFKLLDITCKIKLKPGSMGMSNNPKSECQMGTSHMH
jgi:hypothetical protein